MDVRCSTCEEPWDTYHLSHDAIFETDLTVEEARSWQRLPREEKLSRHYRRRFRDAGWEFGASLMNVCRCPACPEEAKPDWERLQTKAALEQLFGNDEDGLAATFEDYCL